MDVAQIRMRSDRKRTTNKISCVSVSLCCCSLLTRSNLLRSTIRHPATPSSLRTSDSPNRTRSSSPRSAASSATPGKLRSREGSPHVAVQQRSSSEDIPLENLSRSSTPVLGGKPIPIAVSSTVNSGSQLRNSPRKHQSFDGGISVSSSPATSILGSSAGGGAGGALAGHNLVTVAKEASQETSFMGGPEEERLEVEQQQQEKRKGAIETV